jgi:hypothetical protein
MIHIRIDKGRENSRREFACGIGPNIPPGDVYFFYGELGNVRIADCPGCNPERLRATGTPLSEIDRARFVEIARSWGNY